MSLNVGDRIGDYEVLGVLGVGGMGEVYKARNIITNRVEAVKIVLPNMAEHRELAERFLREIRLHASLDHPNIAEIRTAFHEGDRLIMVMELVEGETLAARLAAGKMPLAAGLGYLDQLLSALNYVHERSLVHRDIKPANIMLTPDGQVKLMDFGVAKDESGLALTKVGFTVGSLHYMSPEQIQAGVVDARSDLYSLGIVMYQALTGQRPFEGASESAILAGHLTATPAAPAQLDPDIPPPLSDVVLMALSKEPGKRFQTGRAMQNALRGVAKSLDISIVLPAQVSAPAAAEPPTEPMPGAAELPTEPMPAAAAVQAPSSAPPPTLGAPPLAAAASPPTPPPPALGSPVPSGKPRSGMRLGYMLIGALAAVIVLAVGITQIPKWRSAQAEPAIEEAAEEVAVSAPEATPPEEVEQPPVEIASTPLAPTPAATRPPAEPSAAKPQSSPPPAPTPVKSAPPAAPAKPAAAPPARPPQNEVMPPIEQTTGFQDARNAARLQREEEEKAARFAALDELREQQIMMVTRISAVRSALDKLEREQSAMGLSLRGDMAGARQLLETRSMQADAAIEAGNIDAAKKYLDQAESQLAKLERFLNI